MQNVILSPKGQFENQCQGLRSVPTCSVQTMGNSDKNLSATEMRASSGQGKNQSMVVPLMRPGNCCARFANWGPTGLKHRHTCRRSRTRPRKKLYSASYVSMPPVVAVLHEGTGTRTACKSESKAEQSCFARQNQELAW